MSDSLKTFKDKLANNEYVSCTGAKRAIGKFREMSDAERDQARKLADKHFGVSGTQAAAPAAKAAPKGRKKQVKKKAAPKKAKGSKTAAKPAAPAKTAPAKAAPKKAATKVAPKKATRPSAPAVAQELNHAHTVMTTMDAAIASAKNIKDIDNNVDVTNILNLATEGIVAAQRSAMQVVGMTPPPAPELAEPESPSVEEPAPAPTNGVSTTAVAGSTTLPGASGALPGLPKQRA